MRLRTVSRKAFNSNSAAAAAATLSGVLIDVNQRSTHLKRAEIGGAKEENEQHILQMHSNIQEPLHRIYRELTSCMQKH